jgi:hypothetical protein
MRVTCTECHGRRKMDYHVPQPMPRAVSMDMSVTATSVVEIARNQPCRTCGGDGTVAATERIPVMQDGKRVGTVPPSFDLEHIKSTSWLYDPRPGDFRREGDALIASRMLGPGDLESVRGFVWDLE